MKKEKRQKKILELIAERSIGTQEELTKALLAEGCQTTQATVSRDIREMGLRKVSEDGRGSHYVAGISGTSTTYRQILSSGILSMEPAGNLIVVRTVSGAAMAVGAALDHMQLDGQMVKVHERELNRKLNKEQRAMMKRIMALPDFSWQREEPLMLLLKAISKSDK